MQMVLWALGLGILLWFIIGIQYLPIFRGHTVVLWYAAGDGRDMESGLRALGWLWRNGMREGSVVVVDCGLTAEGLTVVQLLQSRWNWLRYCPQETLGDYLKLAEDKV